MIDSLHYLGFGADDPDRYFDKGKAPAYVTCLTRRWRDAAYQGCPHPLPPSQYQYLTITHAHDDGRFLEACLQVYAQPWDPRAKRRQLPLYSNLLRSLDEILAAVNAVYPPTPKP